MTYTNLHLHLTPHSIPAPTAVVDYACDAAKLLSADLAVSTSRLRFVPPANWLTGALVVEVAANFEEAAERETSALISRLEKRGLASGVRVEISTDDWAWPSAGANSSWRGRLSDLCILNLSPDEASGWSTAVDWLFGSGRPCLLYPDKSSQAFSLSKILVCWDYSRAATRAVADALPMLHNAGSVHIVTIDDDKDTLPDAGGNGLAAYLAGHGVKATPQSVLLRGRTTGSAILDHAKAIGADLIVVGAFGHSRMSEFIMGGATQDLLQHSDIPLLMSH